MARGGGPGGGGGGGEPTPGDAILQDGNSFGQDILIGPLDNHDLVFMGPSGVHAWRIGAGEALTPEADGTQDMGSPAKRVGSIFSQSLKTRGVGDPFDNFSAENGSVLLGPGTSSPDWELEYAATGTALIPTGSKLQQTDPPTVGADLVNKTYADSLVFGGNAFLDGGDSFGADATLGLNDDFDLTFVQNATPIMQLQDTGTMGFTGPRICIGDDFTPLYANADIVTIQKNLGDQLLFAMRNTYGQGMGETMPASSTMGVANDLGGGVPHMGTLEIFNSTWTPGTDGVNPDEVAVISFGGVSLRLLTQNDAPIYLSSNEKQIAKFYEDAVNQEHIFEVQGAVNRLAVAQVRSIGTSGTGYGARYIGTNADGKNFWASIPDSGASPSWNDEAGYLTISTDTGIGGRFTVNQNTNSGWRVTPAAEVILGAPAAVPSSGELFNGSIAVSLDEAGNTLKIKAKYSDGTVKNLTTPLALS